MLLDYRRDWARAKEWRCTFQPLLPERSTRAEMRQYGPKACKVLEAVAALPSSRLFVLEQPETMEAIDTIVIVSDEVWNLCHPRNGGRRTFYGEGLQVPRVVSYAASFSN